MTKITVFGATGGTGKELVKQALAAGYEVVAYARDPSKFEVSHHFVRFPRAVVDRVDASNWIAGIHFSNPFGADPTTPVSG